jgi:hypothetical protein
VLTGSIYEGNLLQTADAIVDESSCTRAVHVWGNLSLECTPVICEDASTGVKSIHSPLSGHRATWPARGKAKDT